MPTESHLTQVQLARYGAADVLQLTTAPLPALQPGEVLIGVEAAGVNFSDVLRRRNTYFMPTPLPYVLGAEAVGQVLATGAGVDAPFVPGSRVLAILPGGGGYASHVVAQAAYCVPLPAHIDPKAATAIFVQGSTAYLMLHQLVGDLAGKTLLVMAAAGGVGSLLVQLATLAGAQVIAAASTEAKLQVARQLGAMAGVNYAQAGWPAQVRDLTGGAGVDVVLEMVGGALFGESLQCLRTGGQMVVYGAASGTQGELQSERLVDESWTLRGFNLAHFIQQRPADWQAALGAVIGLMAEGKLHVPTPHVYSLAQAVAAHQALEARQTTGKIVLVP